MKRILASFGLVLVSLLYILVGCGSSARQGYDDPNNPGNGAPAGSNLGGEGGIGNGSPGTLDCKGLTDGT
ncbi:MAG: hypothetical protein QOI41_1677, partial [Myxococcales bacterium]|nr:hypothetical protein [Myxococcales bacterium]